MADWLPVTTGESGALVFRSADGTRYRKVVGTPADRLGIDGLAADWRPARGPQPAAGEHPAVVPGFRGGGAHGGRRPLSAPVDDARLEFHLWLDPLTW